MNQKKSQTIESDNSANAYKISLLFIILLLGFLVFTLRMLYIATIERKIPSTTAVKVDSAIRGTVISSDKFDLTASEKLYKASVYVETIDPAKKELFIKLFSIYSDIDENKIRAKLENNSGITVLSYGIDEKHSKRLKELRYKLNLRKVFREYEDKNGRIIDYGLSIIESGERRKYIYNDSLEPLVGYIKKYENSENITKIKGVKGVEKYYNDKLAPIQSKREEGDRDIGSNIILNKEYKQKERIDGLNIHLNIPLKFQQSIENMLDSKKIELNAKEIIVGIMDSKTGKILSLATSNRFNPNSIKVEDYPYLNANAVEHSFEAGSVMKPIVFSSLLDEDLVDLEEKIDVEGGSYKLGNKIIRDSHVNNKPISMTKVIVQSSNVAMAKLAQRFDAPTYYKKLTDFGFNQLTGIDLPYEKKGVFPDLATFQNEVSKGTISYGYGIQVTFIQILQAYTAFNNDGKIVSPKIAKYIAIRDKGYLVDSNQTKQAVSKQSAKIMQNLLIENVQRGTGRGTRVKNIIIGGKTGTAHIAREGSYAKLYNSSFFGFINDLNRSYTVGVTVFQPKGKYFSSQTAVKVFKELANILVKQGYIKEVKFDKKEKGK